jgi:hypothetical protein
MNKEPLIHTVHPKEHTLVWITEANQDVCLVCGKPGIRRGPTRHTPILLEPTLRQIACKTLTEATCTSPGCGAARYEHGDCYESHQ